MNNPDPPSAPGRKGLPIGALLFTAAYGAIHYGFRALDVWNSRFDQPGPLYVVNHLLRLAFLVFFAWIVDSLGRTILERTSRKGEPWTSGPVDGVLLSSFTGASVLTVVTLILGAFGGLYPGVALALTAPIVFLSYPRFKRILASLRGIGTTIRNDCFADGSRPFKLATGWLAFCVLLQLVILVVSKGLMPDVLTNDTMGHYLPYFEQVLRDHGTGLNKHFLHYFYSKGDALFFLASLLTDVQTTQLVSLYFVLLSALMLYALVAGTIGDRAPWGLLASMLYLAILAPVNERAVVTEFQKAHLVIGAFLLFIAYMTGLARRIPPERMRRWSLLQAFIAVVLVLMSPVSCAFVLPYLLLQALFFRRATVRQAVLPLAAATAAFAFMLGMNYFCSGLAEGTPLPFWLKHGDFSRIKSWVSPAAIQFQIAFNTANGEGAGEISLRSALSIDRLTRSFWEVFHQRQLIPRTFFNVVVPAAVVVLAMAAWRRRVDRERMGRLLPFALLQVITFGLLAVTNQHSIYRYAAFRVFVQVLVYGGALAILLSIAKPGRLREWAVLGVMVAASLFTTIRTAERSKYFTLRDKVDFLAGKSSYADAYGKAYKDIRAALKVQRAIEGEKVELLSFLHGVTGLPGNRFQFPLMCDYNRSGDFEDVMFGSPERAAEALKRNQLNYFMMRTDLPLLFAGYAPLFEPDQVGKYFRAVDSGEPGVLLWTWRSGQEKGLDDAQVEEFRKVRDRGRTHPYALTHKTMKSRVAGKSD
jgi:hypothetical protein